MKYSKHFLLMGIAAFLFIAGCKKDKKDPLVAPSVITVAMTEITTTTATAGGAISNDGGAAVTEAGVYYSMTNHQPVSTDSKVLSTATSGTFSVNLTGLKAGSTYYLRAYAINSAGTGYGEVMTFMTGNAAPEAKNVTVAGEVRTGVALTAAYTYFDNENNAEGVSTYQWYIANDTIGAAVTPINGATAKTYTVATTDETKFIKVGVSAKATAGTTDGVEVKSKWYGPVGGETVTFSYNGKTVTYGVIKSSVTGRKWLDRNLGAPNMPSAYDDYANLGDLFQWGRGADGHQLINRGPDNASTIASGDNPETSSIDESSTNMLSSQDNPGHKKFITTSWPQANWRVPAVNNLWQFPNLVNNPCPNGWHVPSESEWEAEQLDKYITNNGWDQLKITVTGYRAFDNALCSNTQSRGYYWTSTGQNGYDDQAHMWSFKITGERGQSPSGGDFRAQGLAVRCIKDN